MKNLGSATKRNLLLLLFATLRYIFFSYFRYALSRYWWVWWQQYLPSTRNLRKFIWSLHLYLSSWLQAECSGKCLRRHKWMSRIWRFLRQWNLPKFARKCQMSMPTRLKSFIDGTADCFDNRRGANDFFSITNWTNRGFYLLSLLCCSTSVASQACTAL